MDYTPKNTHTSILITLAAIASKHRHTWSYPSQSTIRRNTAQFSGHRMSSATLNRHLRGLERDHWIRRQHRHRLQPGGHWEFRSTLYVLTRRAWKYLAAIHGAVQRFSRKMGQVVDSLSSLNSEKQYCKKTITHAGGGDNAHPPPAITPYRPPSAAEKECGAAALSSIKDLLRAK